jgi:phosphatidylserine decarboxylase
MRPELFISSILLSLILLTLLAWRWRVSIMVAVFGSIVIGILAGFIVSWIDSTYTWLNMAFLVVIELALIFILAAIAIVTKFYRDPERHPGETENVILSPADGKVVYVNNVEKGSSLVSTKGKKKYKLDEITSTGLFTDATCLVGIDMNILNVHVNRTPIGGKITLCKRTKGKFISLRRQESEVMNERMTTVIENGKFKIGVVQISSRLVRKIVSYIKEGDSLDIGHRLGAIVFGSQVDVVIPELNKLRIEVKPGDEVKAGISIIARYDS